MIASSKRVSLREPWFTFCHIQTTIFRNEVVSLEPSMLYSDFLLLPLFVHAPPSTSRFPRDCSILCPCHATALTTKAICFAIWEPSSFHNAVRESARHGNAAAASRYDDDKNMKSALITLISCPSKAKSKSPHKTRPWCAAFGLLLKSRSLHETFSDSSSSSSTVNNSRE